MKIEIRVWKDIDFTVQMRREDEESWVDFTVYAIEGGLLEEDGGNVWYEQEGSMTGEMTEDLSTSSIYLSGNIKWDGCSNMTFNEQDRCMLHFCGRQNAMYIGDLLGRLYDLALEMMPEHAYYFSK